MKIAATVQARMGSSRLPGKVLLPVAGRPMLQFQVERIQQSRLIDEVIIATTVKPPDDPIEQLAHRIGVACFRGSEEDVLSRVAEALRAFEVDLHVEFTGDNPLPDPLLVDTFIGYYLKHSDRYDLVTSALKTTYPPGAEVTVYPSRILFDLEGRVTDPALREHVGSLLLLSPERYRICNLEAPVWLRYPDFYLEVDEKEDLEVISAIAEHLYPSNPGFNLAQMIDFLVAHPELAQRNRHVKRRWKVFRKEVGVS